jgi:predicted small secreted protein
LIWKDVMMRNLSVIATLLAVAFAVSACATVKGVGKDIQSVGQAGQRVIDEAKK